MSRILGVNTRYFPTQASVVGHEPIPIAIKLADGWKDFSEDPPPTVTVLVAGDVGDYAAYTGHGRAEWVAEFGDKISFEEACVHFPGGQLKKELYRS